MSLRPVVLIVAALAAAPAVAQQPCATCTQAVTLNVQVPTILRLVVDAPTTVVAAASEAGYDRGYEVTAGPTATVKSNVPWRLDISTTQETWTPSGAGARRQLARRHLRQAEPAFLQQFLRHDDDLVSRQRRADYRVRTGYIVGETVTRHQLDAAATLLEMRNPVGLKQYFDERMAAQFCGRSGMRKPMLARLDLTEL